MKLKEWREKNDKTQQWVADELTKLAQDEGDAGERVTDSSVQRWEAGTVPRQQNIRRVMKLTGDQVTFADFYGDGGKPRAERATAGRVKAARKGWRTRHHQASQTVVSASMAAQQTIQSEIAEGKPKRPAEAGPQSDRPAPQHRPEPSR